MIINATKTKELRIDFSKSRVSFSQLYIGNSPFEVVSQSKILGVINLDTDGICQWRHMFFFISVVSSKPWFQLSYHSTTKLRIFFIYLFIHLFSNLWAVDIVDKMLFIRYIWKHNSDVWGHMEVMHIQETNYMYNFTMAGWQIFAEFKSIVDWVIGEYVRASWPNTTIILIKYILFENLFCKMAAILFPVYIKMCILITGMLWYVNVEHGSRICGLSANMYLSVEIKKL